MDAGMTLGDSRPAKGCIPACDAKERFTAAPVALEAWISPFAELGKNPKLSDLRRF